MQEADTDICEDCMGFVAARPELAPHQGMRVTRLVIGMAFCCTRCGMLWERQPLGWASLAPGSYRVS